MLALLLLLGAALGLYLWNQKQARRGREHWEQFWDHRRPRRD